MNNSKATHSTTSREPFEQARELERLIAESLWSTRPLNERWDKITYIRMETGGTGGSIAKFYLNGQECGRAHTAAAVLFAAKKLRKTMYQLGKGAWLSMSLTVNPAGDGWESTYNYTDKPVWELGEPGPNAYAQELYLFPRDEKHIPNWFREEMRGSTWTPDSD